MPQKRSSRAASPAAARLHPQNVGFVTVLYLCPNYSCHEPTGQTRCVSFFVLSRLHRSASGERRGTRSGITVNYHPHANCS
eukprot:4470505-Prymnesium_polylepis.1